MQYISIGTAIWFLDAGVQHSLMILPRGNNKLTACLSVQHKHHVVSFPSLLKDTHVLMAQCYTETLEGFQDVTKVRACIVLCV